MAILNEGFGRMKGPVEVPISVGHGAAERMRSIDKSFGIDFQPAPKNEVKSMSVTNDETVTRRIEDFV